MNKIKICLSQAKLREKPNKAETALLASYIADSEHHLDNSNIRSFAEGVGQNGKTFCPATFKGNKKSKEYFEQMQMFALDFDGKQTISHQEVCDRAKQYNLPILFSYETLGSNTDRKRFRAVFLNDVPVSDIRAAEIKHDALKIIFPEADDNCSIVQTTIQRGK